jgi:transketolase
MISSNKLVDEKLKNLEKDFIHWEKTKDIIDQLIDIILNYRQSGHPGGSRSKVHAFLTLLLSGTMRWDVRDPAKKFGDRFILSAGHTIPLVYCTLAVMNEAMRIKYAQTGDTRYALPSDPKYVLTWEDLLNFRHRHGLSGHAEMEGKTLFLKFNSGPSGHGSTAAVGEALALKRAGAKGVRVFVLEGEGGLTPGANHEVMDSAWGLKLDNLFFIIDWNDFGIDDHPLSKIVYGTPADWFGSHGWRVIGTEKGEDWGSVTSAFLTMVAERNPEGSPSVVWSKTRKGRGYLKYDNSSHGIPHPMDSEIFWETKRPFREKYDAHFCNFGGPAPKDADELKTEFHANLKAVMDVLRQDQCLVDYLADRLVEIGDSIPETIPSFRFGKHGNPFNDSRLFDFKAYPENMYAKPGESLANRAALAKWGAWVNAFGAREYGQPVFIACSADLCESTNISGFGKAFGDFPGYGWYERKGTDEGVLLPQAITEMTNSGLVAGLAAVNFADHPESEFLGLWGACSTYGSFSYLKYGMFRLFSQLAQGCQWKTGKVLWVASHSGPETADDSRTHFGIFAPGVTQLFPKGQIINLYPWEYNEVPVLLGAAFSHSAPIVALHLTRPAIEIPDREKLGMPSHFEAARGAYIVRDFKAGQPRGGTLFVQGTSAMANLIKIFRELDSEKLNVKIVYAASAELFALQPADYRAKVITPADRVDSTVITTQSKMLMHDWIFNKVSEEYALSADWDDRWRTGGTLEEVMDESHLSPAWLLQGIRKFVVKHEERIVAIQNEIDQAA